MRRRAGGRTSWAETLAGPIRDIRTTESGGVAVRLGVTLVPLPWANSPRWHSYESAGTMQLAVRLGDHGVQVPEGQL
jgi:hypothetical protein